MEPEIIAAIVAAIITPLMSAAFWFIQKRLEKKKNEQELKKKQAETEQIEAKTDNVDAETIKTLHNLYNEVLIKLGEVNANNMRQSQEIARLTGTQGAIVKQNLSLAEENARMAESIRVVQKENEDLREIVASEQLDKRRLKAGIKKLIQQMKDNGIEEPAFILE